MNFISTLFSVYIKNNFYKHIENVEELELLAFTNGIRYILASISIDENKIETKNGTLKEDIDEIILAHSSSKLKISEQEKINDYFFNKDNISI